MVRKRPCIHKTPLRLERRFGAPKGHWPPVVFVADGHPVAPTAGSPAALSLYRAASLAVVLAGRLLFLADSFSEAAGTSLAPI